MLCWPQTAASRSDAAVPRGETSAVTAPTVTVETVATVAAPLQQQSSALPHGLRGAIDFSDLDAAASIKTLGKE